VDFIYGKTKSLDKHRDQTTKMMNNPKSDDDRDTDVENDEVEHEDAPIAKRRKLVYLDTPAPTAVGGMMKRAMVPKNIDHNSVSDGRSSSSSSSSLPNQTMSKNMLRRTVAKTQHTSAPVDDIEDLRNQLSDDDEMSEDDVKKCDNNYT
jgi:hypothetical protein